MAPAEHDGDSTTIAICASGHVTLAGLTSILENRREIVVACGTRSMRELRAAVAVHRLDVVVVDAEFVDSLDDLRVGCSAAR